MKRHALKSLLAALFSVFILLAGCAGEPKILIYTRSGSGDAEFVLKEELAVMTSVLDEAGLRYDVAADSEAPYGLKIDFEPDLLLADVKVSKYAGFLLPCMAGGAPGVAEAQAIEMIRQAAAQGKPVAAQHGSIYTLSRAGLLEGKHYAYPLSVFPEGICDGPGVVQDGLVITSGVCPYWSITIGQTDGTAVLTCELIAAVAR